MVVVVLLCFDVKVLCTSEIIFRIAGLVLKCVTMFTVLTTQTNSAETYVGRSN